MLNRLDHPLLSSDDEGPSSSGWSTDQNPGLRLAVLFLCLLLPLLAIGVRLLQVQVFLGDEYAAAFEITTTKREPIPSRDGRILTADGEVLAEDVQLFRVRAHYRWLEQPADPGWVRQHALSRLTRQERRQPERVQRELDSLLRQRDEMWQRLARLTHQDPQALDRERQRIQTRVERIAASVEERRQQRRQTAVAPRESWWRRALQQFVLAITTAPERTDVEPIVVAEELDYHVVLAEVSMEVAAEIESHPERYPGIRIELSTQRRYPRGDLVPHLLGYRTPVTSDWLQERRQQFPKGDPLDYQPGDRRGITGIERYYERHLRGLRGERKLVMNRRGEVIQQEITRPPRRGRDLVLTLNVPLQEIAGRLLDQAVTAPGDDVITHKPLPVPTGGCLVAIDVRTGAVLAACSAPRYDVNVLLEHNDEAWQRIIGDDRKPLFSRATKMTLPPGSIYKVLSSIALLEGAGLDPEQTFHCQGFLDNPDAYRCLVFRHYGVGHGAVNLVDALARSCNVYFFAAARRSGIATGARALHDWSLRMGFGQPTGIDVPGERSGTVPVLGVDNPRKSIAAGETLQVAIGQGQLTVTPLQVARLMAAVANGGQLVTPHLVEGEGPAVILASATDGVGLDEGISAPAPQPIPGLSPRTLEWVRAGLRQVIAHPQGTGYKTVRLKNVAIAGKTGTAESGGGRPDHAWFAGYVPAESPRVAFVVVLEHAGSGGHAAGPVARDLVRAMLQTGIISRE